jgi:hypothetical protein
MSDHYWKSHRSVRSMRIIRGQRWTIFALALAAIEGILLVGVAVRSAYRCPASGIERM